MTEEEDLDGKSRQRFKGASSIRKVPIAQPLLDAGFLDFIEDIRECGHPRLFPNLSAGINRTTGVSNDCYSMSFIGQYSRYLKTLGFAKGVAFHAFRHTLATRLVERGATLPDVALISGHSEGSGYKQLKQYVHVRPVVLREKQAATLDLFNPRVVFPRYERGQFKHRLGVGAKKYP
ncbi:tyrosine-type recombinase/integrase [Luteimonas fraxinea]|uniref:Tyrosine-type recombinase/integrase n=1 Tax=Luteimonas fraxinea TaxID=2901869 RepID=A0ABS8UEW4_9GAMM|nr:tyrosine-type recombinase/integrase [Luteimonas fraxinea]MCD9098040.1 tyrosine-type recombinase/integrase [Luteimonas fraxinea]UHH09235.1 tyrosine-type recombinase/integrase [Luteimonas fraxinea]